MELNQEQLQPFREKLAALGKSEEEQEEWMENLAKAVVAEFVRRITDALPPGEHLPENLSDEAAVTAFLASHDMDYQALLGDSAEVVLEEFAARLAI